jgi:hypothetical protein
MARTPVPRSSTSKECVQLSKWAFVAAYVPIHGTGANAAVEATL